MLKLRRSIRLEIKPSITVVLIAIGIAITLIGLCDANGSKELPCRYLDSVNITDGIRYSNGSIVSNGVTFHEHQYAEVNFIVENADEKVTVDPHIRGCLCSIKSCARLCCPYGSYMMFSKGKPKCAPHEAAKQLEKEVLHEDNSTKLLKLDQHFAFINHMPCEHFFYDDFNLTHVRSDTAQKGK